MGDGDVGGQRTDRQHVQSTVERVPLACRSGVDGVAERADHVDLLEPQRSKIDRSNGDATDEDHRPALRRRPDRQPDRRTGADCFDHAPVAAGERRAVALAPQHAAAEAGQLAPVVAGVVGDHDMFGTKGARRVGLMGVTSEHRHRALRRDGAQGHGGGETDDPGTDDEHRIAIDRRVAHDRMHRYRQRLGQHRGTQVEVGRQDVQLADVRGNTLAPTTAEPGREPDAEACGEDLATERVAGTVGAVLAWLARRPAACRAGDRRIDGDASANGDRALGPGGNDRAGDLMAHLHRRADVWTEDPAT